MFECLTKRLGASYDFKFKSFLYYYVARLTKLLNDENRYKKHMSFEYKRLNCNLQFLYGRLIARNLDTFLFNVKNVRDVNQLETVIVSFETRAVLLFIKF